MTKQHGQCTRLENSFNQIQGDSTYDGIAPISTFWWQSSDPTPWWNQNENWSNPAIDDSTFSLGKVVKATLEQGQTYRVLVFHNIHGFEIGKRFVSSALVANRVTYITSGITKGDVDTNRVVIDVYLGQISDPPKDAEHSNTNLFIHDSDGDSLSDMTELSLHTDPNLQDTDNNGINDYHEDRDGGLECDGSEADNGRNPWDPSDDVLRKIPPLSISFQLFQNIPNPFNPATTISYRLTKAEKVLLKVYNIQGQLIEILVNEFQTAKLHKVPWDGSRFSSGVYFFKITAGNFVSVRKGVLVR